MQTLFIVLGWVFLIHLYHNYRKLSFLMRRRVGDLESRYGEMKKLFNKNSQRANEHFRAFQELAGMLGYCVHEEREFRLTVDSLFGIKPSESISRLVVHKKGLVAKPAKKLVVNKKKLK